PNLRTVAVSSFFFSDEGGGHRRAATVAAPLPTSWSWSFLDWNPTLIFPQTSNLPVDPSLFNTDRKPLFNGSKTCSSHPYPTFAPSRRFLGANRRELLL
ncbi:hypothetical protein LINPERHAP2_LOCUS42995, partial [Linum perenne]